ncbi:5-oxoprolinase subunit B family protein [Mycolicibacterium lacusdiani]|uniref:5-oxoprolinase subunit B family protein n=1 Tax=Mycolicibacterium lacusdiani TaxID=2895283 RepID=UPI001F3483A6|nr:allophanate hydrolase subunit 1 [Mycolicibacterium lacusdiani]
MLAIGAVRDYGEQALLLEFGGTAEVLAWTDAVRAENLPGVRDVVPAARTVLVEFAEKHDVHPARQRLADLRIDESAVDPEPPADGHVDVTLDVAYDGPDLDEVSRLVDLSPDEVVAAHTATPMRVGFGGFAPGFAYLVGGDARLHVPRRAEPRTRVPAGSVGLAGEFSGVYPRETPGGWQLIGRTDAVLWDVDRPTPALLTPGSWVQFRAIG